VTDNGVGDTRVWHGSFRQISQSGSVAGFSGNGARATGARHAAMAWLRLMQE
jgi:hypothetical protein